MTAFTTATSFHDDIDVNGTSLQGHVSCGYEDIVRCFGEPIDLHTLVTDGKVDVEWVIRFEDGTVATIYNWKNGPNYCGDAGLYRHEVVQYGWHIGARNKHTVRLLEEAIAYHQVNQQMDAMSESMNAVGGE